MRRRLHNGFTASVLYTYSKSIDDAATLGTSAGQQPAQNWLDLRAERGPSSFDQRHLASVTLQYTSGMGVGGGALMSGWRGKVLKDWTFLDSFDAGSGLPLTPLSGTDFVGTTGTPARASYNGQDIYAGGGNGQYLNPLAVVAPFPGQWGNAGRNSLRGPAQFTMNATHAACFQTERPRQSCLDHQRKQPAESPDFRSYKAVITNSTIRTREQPAIDAHLIHPVEANVLI